MCEQVRERLCAMLEQADSDTSGKKVQRALVVSKVQRTTARVLFQTSETEHRETARVSRVSVSALCL